MTILENLHNNKPAPFNKHYKPHAKVVGAQVVRILEYAKVYDRYSREEIASLYSILFNQLMETYDKWKYNVNYITR